MKRPRTLAPVQNDNPAVLTKRPAVRTVWDALLRGARQSVETN